MKKHIRGTRALPPKYASETSPSGRLATVASSNPSYGLQTNCKIFPQGNYFSYTLHHEISFTKSKQIRLYLSLRSLLHLTTEPGDASSIIEMLHPVRLPKSAYKFIQYLLCQINVSNKIDLYLLQNKYVNNSTSRKMGNEQNLGHMDSGS